MTIQHDDETVLAEFGRWLREARADADELARPGEDGGTLPAEADLPEVGLERIVEEFTALRQEVKLQTKSSRGLQDQAEALLPALRQAIDHFRSVAPKEEQAAQSASRPMAEALADLDEALERGRAEIERARRRIDDEAQAAKQAALDGLQALFAGQGWYQRFKTRSFYEQALAVVRDGDRRPGVAIFDALLEGYALVQGRLGRTLKAEQIRRIECLGRPADPGLMTVVEVVDDPDAPSGTVVDEIRRGYTWRGRVLRFAEVRVARSPVVEGRGEAEDENEDDGDGPVSGDDYLGSPAEQVEDQSDSESDR